MLTTVLPPRHICHKATKVATLLALLVLALIVASMASCQATPARQAFVTVEGATAAVTGVNDAATLSPKFRAQLPKLAPYVHAVKVAQDSLDDAIAAHKVDLSAYNKALDDAVLELLNAKADVAKVAATQP